MKRLLVTGGSGFIGSNFILFLMERYADYRIYNLDLLTYAGNQENLRELANVPNYYFIQGDIADKSIVRSVMAEGIDTVVHFAAESHVDRSILEPERFVKTNLVGTHTLLEEAKQHGIEKFIHISTDEVYGSLGPSGYFTENSPIAPNSPYSATKAGSDLLARSYYETYELPVVISRCSNNYGPCQNTEKLIPLIITNALLNKEIPVYGDGLNIRDWLYVEDHCRAIDLLIHQGIPGEVYNIGGNNEFTNLDIAYRILDVLGKPATLLKFVTDRLGHDRRYAIDASKITHHLGWRAHHSFAKGLAQTIEWYMEHPAWFGQGDRH